MYFIFFVSFYFEIISTYNVLLNGIVENVSKGINVLNFLRFQPTQPLVLNICKLKYNFLMAFCFYFIIK